jgi:hypothetical protein
MQKRANNSFLAPLLILGMCITNCRADAQEAHKLIVSYSASEFSLTNQPSNGRITCTVKDGVIKKSDTGVRLYFYAKSDLRNTPMQLLYKRKPVPAKKLHPARNNNDNIVFTAPANDIFFIEDNKTNYSWKWKGRAKAPLSPAVGLNSQSVEKIDCWFILQVNKHAYTSDTLSLQVQ